MVRWATPLGHGLSRHAPPGGRGAWALHYLSRRAGKPFLPVNCGAIPVELFERELFGHQKGAFTGAWTAQSGLIAEAERGTLFLDEIATLSLSAQAKLLRYLEAHPEAKDTVGGMWQPPAEDGSATQSLVCYVGLATCTSLRPVASVLPSLHWPCTALALHGKAMCP